MRRAPSRRPSVQQGQAAHVAAPDLHEVAMDFRPSVEQDMLRESVRRYLAAEQSFEKRRRRLAEGGPGDWEGLAAMGWPAMAVDEEAGGLGSGFADIAMVCEEFGRGLSLEPFAACGVLPARILNRAARTPVVAALLEHLAGGARMAVALHEPAGRYELLRPRTVATPMEDGSYRLSGRKLLAVGGAAAGHLIVSARLAAGGAEGCALFVVDAQAAGIERCTYRMLDDLEAADFGLADVRVGAEHLLAFAGGTQAGLEAALDEARVCLCADAVGGMDAAVAMTADYLKVRTQFGRPLADFQALQHAVAEIFVEAAGARAMLYQALGALDTDAGRRRRAVSGCMVKVMEAARDVFGTAVHLHGGIGVTSEYPVGHYLRRTLVAERLLGDNEFHLQAYLNAWSGAAMAGAA
jgi:acyl-CoA dehydrogenase